MTRTLIAAPHIYINQFGFPQALSFGALHGISLHASRSDSRDEVRDDAFRECGTIRAMSVVLATALNCVDIYAE